MVAKNDILTAQEQIEETLREFVHHRGGEVVHVFESEWGHLRAIIATNAFKDMNVVLRQEMIWDWLREHVASEHLVFLYGVHAMDDTEYKRSVKTD